MFGHHESAQAKVLLAEMVFGFWEEEHHTNYEFVLEVYPANGQAFRAKTRHHFLNFTPHPEVGHMVNVTYDPKSLEVKLDLKDDDRYGEKGLKHKQQAGRQAEKARIDELLSAPPGTPVSSPLLKGINPADLDPELLELVRMEEAERLAKQAASASAAGSAGRAGLDPELQELMQMEEAERLAARGAQMPAGFPGMAAPQAAMGPAEAQRLRQELEYTGASGQAKILRKQQAGAPVQHLTPFLVEVLVQPDASGYPFQCSFTAWIDTSKGTLMEGYTIPVKYDPQNTARMAFLIPT